MGTVTRALEWYDTTRVRAFEMRDQLAWPAKLLLAFDTAAVTGLLAQVRFFLPFTPVPLTGQVLGVLLAGALLGGGWGGVSMAIYVGLGAAGVGWFADFTSGWGVLAGVTGGYLVGFVIAAALVGWLTARLKFARRFWPQCLLMLVGVAVIYLFGAVQFSLVFHANLAQTLTMAVLPFIGADCLKAFMAASIARAVLPGMRRHG